VPLVILDRDGVINHDSEDYVKSPQEWVPIPGSLQAIGRLTAAGFTVAVVTNQAGIGRKLFDIATLEAIHAKMHDAVAVHGGRIDAVFYCPHAPEAGCACRKPQPGMLQSALARFAATAAQVPVIGDSLRDLQAAAAIGAQSVLVQTGNGRETLARGEVPADTVVVEDLAGAVELILNGSLNAASAGE
jgi:D-glycero-D-manno-heptose 1,7-bisphosphate phosphatase